MSSVPVRRSLWNSSWSAAACRRLQGGRKRPHSKAYGLSTVPGGVHGPHRAMRLGFTVNSEPEKIEQDLMKLIPQKEWTAFSHRLIYHGRQICVARKPHCRECLLNELCPS